jgi:hypothetical protein
MKNKKKKKKTDQQHERDKSGEGSMTARSQSITSRVDLLLCVDL